MKFTFEQKAFLCDLINQWYLDYKHRMTNNEAMHCLGMAKEDLKDRICGITLSWAKEEFLKSMRGVDEI